MPLGAIGMSVFAIDLYFASRGLRRTWLAQGVGAFLAAASALARAWPTWSLLALFAGLYSVPMYALIQIRCEPRTARASSPPTTS